MRRECCGDILIAVRGYWLLSRTDYQQVIWLNQQAGGDFTNATLYQLPRIRLRRESQSLDWIDEHDSFVVHVEFCEWLATILDSPTPVTNKLVATDHDASIELYRWNLAFAVPLTTGETDRLLGTLGAYASVEPVQSFPTWMTQAQAWKMWSFFRSSLRPEIVLVQERVMGE